MKIYTETLPKDTAKVLGVIKTITEIRNYYLSGGTALALQLGHRESEDLDFFNQNQFNSQILQQRLSTYGVLESVEIARGTLNVFLQGVKLQFLHYPYILLEKPTEWNGILVSSWIDIACTKLITISARGNKKDFIDLYMILKQTTLEKLFKKLDEKYQNINYNHAHILKSLIYFEDVDSQPIPRMHLDLDWQTVKDDIIAKVKEFTF